jgi:hypothetical protein
MNKICVLLGFMVCAALQPIQAQNMFDAQRYSTPLYQANARALGISNAVGALGGNPLSSSINPAGMATFPVSEFSFGFAYQQTTNTANYMGNSQKEPKYNLNVPSMALVMAGETQPKDNWVMRSFSITANRANGFSRAIMFSGLNQESTILNRFAEEMDYLWFNDLDIDSSTYGGLACFGYLIDPVYGADSSISHFAPSMKNPDDPNIMQRQSIRSHGQITDLNMTVAGNYKNKLLVGGTIGFPLLTYTEKGSYQEENLNHATDNFNSLAIKHTLTDNGVGMFGQIGFILKPLHAIRLGASIKTPTFYSINRSFDVEFESNTDASKEELKPQGHDYGYTLVSPWSTTLSAAFVIKGFGFISADYSYSDGANARLMTVGEQGDYSYHQENDDIREALSPNHQIRLGGEYVVGPFALRAGQTLGTRAFNLGYMPDKDMYLTQLTTFGLGYREAKFFMDIAYAVASRNAYFQPYSLSYADVGGAEIAETRTTVSITAGFTF